MAVITVTHLFHLLFNYQYVIRAGLYYLLSCIYLTVTVMLYIQVICFLYMSMMLPSLSIISIVLLSVFSSLVFSLNGA